MPHVDLFLAELPCAAQPGAWRLKAQKRPRVLPGGLNTAQLNPDPPRLPPEASMSRKCSREAIAKNINEIQDINKILEETGRILMGRSSLFGNRGDGVK